MEMLLRRQEIDILFLQEVAHPTLNELCNYKTYTSVGTAKRGTALVTQEEITITNITKLPSGRGIAVEFRGIWIINIYAPFGAARNMAREQFFDSELAYLLRASPTTTIVGGDFNCILHQKESTGHFNYSRALYGLVHVFDLWDMWKANPPENGYTYYSPMGATRIDRIYTTKELSTKKVEVETVAAAFTDHLAAILRLSVEVPIIRRSRGLWKMNTSLFDEKSVKENLKQQWALWRQQSRLYPDWPMRWGIDK